MTLEASYTESKVYALKIEPEVNADKLTDFMDCLRAGFPKGTRVRVVNMPYLPSTMVFKL